jgi:hypothetical protein
MQTFSFSFGSQKYDYTLSQPFKEDGETVMQLQCPKINIDQTFLVEDIPEAILDLPNMILNLKQYKTQNTIMKFRLQVEEKKIIEKKALERGYKNTSDFLRSVALAA